MSSHWLITGASGLVGTRLRAALLAEGDRLTLVSRRSRAGGTGERWIAWEELPAAMEEADGVVHLAGKPVMEQRWSDAVVAGIRASRVETTRQVVKAMRSAQSRPRVLVSASASGYYGDRGDEELNEDAGPGEDRMAGICRDWEAAARGAGDAGARVVLLRSGVVLDPDGGALKRMLPPFRWGLGGWLGSGRQWFPWIHVSDLVAMITRALRDEAWSGAVNAVAPEALRNKEFSKCLAATLHRPCLLPVPAFALRVALGGVAGVVLSSQRLVPARAERLGFAWEHPQCRAALEDLVA